MFTDIVYCQIQKLEEEIRINQDEIDGNQWSRFGQQVEVLDEEERWVNYAERALAMLNHEVVWKAIVEACKILKYLNHRKHKEIILKHFVTRHVSFGIKCIPSPRELFL